MARITNHECSEDFLQEIVDKMAKIKKKDGYQQKSRAVVDN